MNRNTLAAACLGVLAVTGPTDEAKAGDLEPLSEKRIWRTGVSPLSQAAPDGMFAVDAGPWTFAPVATLRPSDGGAFRDSLSIAEQPGESVTASLGVLGFAKIDSRIGAIHSRLSLSFEHDFRALDHQVLTGLSGAGPNGFYGDRSEVDVIAADAAFAMRMSEATTGFLEYGSEIEPGGATDHQVMLRLRFNF